MVFLLQVTKSGEEGLKQGYLETSPRLTGACETGVPTYIMKAPPIVAGSKSTKK